MKRQRLGENTGGITQVTGVEFILFAPFITVVMLCFLLVSVSAILYSILKVKSLMIPFQSLAFSHLSGSSCLYFSSGVFGCHSAVLFMTSVRYSNRFTLFILQVSAIVQSMAPRSAPLWLPKNNEFFLDKDMQRFIRSTILLSR